MNDLKIIYIIIYIWCTHTHLGEGGGAGNYYYPPPPPPKKKLIFVLETKGSLELQVHALSNSSRKSKLNRILAVDRTTTQHDKVLFHSNRNELHLYGPKALNWTELYCTYLGQHGLKFVFCFVVLLSFVLFLFPLYS